MKRERQDRFLAELAERARRLTDPDEVIADAVRSTGEFLGVSRCLFVDIDIEADICTVPPDYCADDSVASMAGVFPLSAFGAYVVAEYGAGRAVVVDDVRSDSVRVPAGSLSAYEAVGIRAHASVPVVHSARLVSCIGAHSATPRRWKPEEIELLQIVVERTWLTVEVARQHRQISGILESITDAFFALDREWRFTYINSQAETLWGRERAKLLGKNVWDEFPEAVGSTFDQQFRHALSEQAALSFEEFYPPLNAWLDLRVYPSTDGLSVFFQNVNERKSAEQERERLLVEQHDRAEREALINRIGMGLLTATNSAVTEGQSVTLLGAAMGADRCYLVSWDYGQDRALIFQDYRRADLPSIAGAYSASEYAPVMDILFAQGTAVVPDSGAVTVSPTVAAVMASFGLRSVLTVPFFENGGRLSAALWVAMVNEPRPWTPEETSLVETVATLTSTAVAAARVAERERNIAQHLQDALQPALPEQVPGLEVASFARPALDEAQLGGDFFDIFPLDKELYALVMGDVSGKGLAAAQQLALIRNSLRTTLYLFRAPARAASSLNAIVTAHDLLVGFVTAFVGVYDAATGIVAYASCGHEPGLIRRAGGAIEALNPTGPPLGVDQNADYTEARFTLASGDMLLLYTDGLSEAGPNRQDLLGTDGLTRLFKALPDSLNIRQEAETLVSQASDFAGGIFRDDVAVLLTRRQ